MKTSIIFLAFAGFILAQAFAAPSSDPKSEADAAIEDTRLVTSIETGEESIRTKKSPAQPNTICMEVKDREGSSHFQCADAELAASTQYSSYSPAPSAPSYGPPAAAYGSAPSYKVSYFEINDSHLSGREFSIAYRSCCDETFIKYILSLLLLQATVHQLQAMARQRPVMVDLPTLLLLPVMVDLPTRPRNNRTK